MDPMYAMIPSIKKGVVFSDPSYVETDNGQYRASFSAKDWLMKMEIETDEDNYLFFRATLGRATICQGVKIIGEGEKLKFSYPGRFSLEQYELGIDRVRIFCGSKENFDLYGEAASLYTGTDGYFGDLMVFTCKGEKDPAGFVLIGAIDSELMKAEDLFLHICSSFDGREIDRETYENCIDGNNLMVNVLASSEMAHAKTALGQPNHQEPDLER